MFLTIIALLRSWNNLSKLYTSEKLIFAIQHEPQKKWNEFQRNNHATDTYLININCTLKHAINRIFPEKKQ